ncbi:cytochrome ubiquinol oxidase subunit I [Marinicella meishanensis]|uniref:cytochrome ubiquinol oxidase subunit I n=1 Tax=Marinicella meishanensis TaxID=2873263 RepID=UPI00272E509E|nr:cytochrome ubiquinol oxidase subunit I [Marinicella sp. NBU2979]
MFELFDAVLAARLQFAFTIAFHIIFPAISIGLAWYLMVLQGLWLKTGRDIYRRVWRYWIKVFAVVFGMGVVSGIVMSYQIGTNWSEFSDKTGPILGPLMGYEVLTAFFLEAGFLGVMLFGADRVGRKLHFFATIMVAVGTMISGFWILSVNSWMQTPAGYAINEVGQFIAVDWWQVVFNPSFPYRFAHMMLAAFLTTAFLVGGVAAWHLLKDRSNSAAKLMFSMAMWMALIVSPIQIVAGDLHGLNTLEHQPMKIAAMEGHFEGQQGAPLILFGWPDVERETVHAKVAVPKLASLILTHDPEGYVPGLNDFPKADWPNVPLVFWSFRIMVAIGLAMALVGLWSAWARIRGRLFTASWLHRVAILMAPSGTLAILAGWITTEVGRQPYTVYGLLRTIDSASPLDAPAVNASLLAFVVVYFVVFGAGIFYLFKLFQRTPSLNERDIKLGQPRKAAGITPIQGLHQEGH